MHLISSLHALLTSGGADQNGCQWLSESIPSHSDLVTVSWPLTPGPNKINIDKYLNVFVISGKSFN